VGKRFDGIDDTLAAWIGAQRLFFVATAPLSAHGHVNCSPKGGDCLRVLGPREVAWVDGGGSGIETVAHLRENGRIVLMFCAFEGPARILRLHGRGEVLDPTMPAFEPLLARFPPQYSVRSIVRIDVSRISDSCGYGVPFYEFRAERRDTAHYISKASDATLHRYLVDHNQASIDGLPGLPAEALAAARFRRDP
jgi:hypothetical protein